MTHPETPARPWTALDADAKDALIGELVEALEHWNKQAKCWLKGRQKHAHPGWMRPAIDRARAALAKAHRNG